MKLLLLIALQLGSSGADAYFTNRNMGHGFYEHNPIARPFIRSKPEAAMYFSVGAGMKIGAVCLLRKRHRKLATGFALAGIADNAAGAIFSATH